MAEISDLVLIKEVAHQIVSEEILSNWKFYALVLALQLPLFFVSKLIEKYAGKRGETLATKADFQEILSQLQKTTETAESIKTTVAHKDWSLKEYKTLRRIKLEELLSYLYDIQTMTEDMRGAALMVKEFGNCDPQLNKAVLISKLYFPELADEIGDFRTARVEAANWFLDLKTDVQALRENPEHVPPLVERTRQTSHDKLIRMYQKLTQVEQKARSLMEEILEYSDGKE